MVGMGDYLYRVKPIYARAPARRTPSQLTQNGMRRRKYAYRFRSDRVALIAQRPIPPVNANQRKCPEAGR
jgi:hypothetical protein